MQAGLRKSEKRIRDACCNARIPEGAPTGTYVSNISLLHVPILTSG